MMLLTVPGRVSGQPRSTPVDVFEDDGRRWLVSTHGTGDANWVKNLRAAGRGTLSRGRERFAFTAAELPLDEATTVLTSVVGARTSRRSSGFVLRRALGLPAAASATDFTRIAPQHPVFEVIFEGHR